MRLRRLAKVLALCTALALPLTLANAGCRDCEGSAAPREAGGPTMPVGMLTPPTATVSSAAVVPMSLTERLELARGKTSGAWVELQRASAQLPSPSSPERWKPDSHFVTLDAMGLLHEAFARALPGFDLFLPRTLEGSALLRLRTELVALKARITATPNLEAAKGQWGPVSSLVAELPDEASWVTARDALARTIDGLIGIAAELEGRGESLRVLGI